MKRLLLFSVALVAACGYGGAAPPEPDFQILCPGADTPVRDKRNNRKSMNRLVEPVYGKAPYVFNVKSGLGFTIDHTGKLEYQNSGPALREFVIEARDATGATASCSGAFLFWHYTGTIEIVGTNEQGRLVYDLVHNLLPEECDWKIPAKTRYPRIDTTGRYYGGPYKRLNAESDRCGDVVAEALVNVFTWGDTEIDVDLEIYNRCGWDIMLWIGTPKKYKSAIQLGPYSTSGPEDVFTSYWVHQPGGTGVMNSLIRTGVVEAGTYTHTAIYKDGNTSVPFSVTRTFK